jgi:CheY-like chemotaxis protein
VTHGVCFCAVFSSPAARIGRPWSFTLDGVSRLLVVEDDETIGDVLASSLRAHGHEVSWQRTGRGALDAAGDTDFNLVLLDLGLPDLDGIEVCRRLRARQPATVLVILTARTDEMDVVVGLEAGADDYLTKPVRLGELLARIRAHLRRAGPAAPGTQPARIGDLLVDTASRRVTVSGHEPGNGGEPADADDRGLGRALVRPDQDAGRARRRAAPPAGQHGCQGHGAEDRHAARARLPAGAVLLMRAARRGR